MSEFKRGWSLFSAAALGRKQACVILSTFIFTVVVKEPHQTDTCEEFAFFIWLGQRGISSLGEPT